MAEKEVNLNKDSNDNVIDGGRNIDLFMQLQGISLDEIKTMNSDELMRKMHIIRELFPPVEDVNSMIFLDKMHNLKDLTERADKLIMSTSNFFPKYRTGSRDFWDRMSEGNFHGLDGTKVVFELYDELFHQRKRFTADNWFAVQSLREKLYMLNIHWTVKVRFGKPEEEGIPTRCHYFVCTRERVRTVDLLLRVAPQEDPLYPLMCISEQLISKTVDLCIELLDIAAMHSFSHSPSVQELSDPSDDGEEEDEEVI